MIRMVHLRQRRVSCSLWLVTFSIFLAATVSFSSASNATESFILEDHGAEGQTNPRRPKRVVVDIPPFSAYLILGISANNPTNTDVENLDLESASEDLRLITMSHIEHSIENELKDTSVFLKRIELDADVLLLNDNKRSIPADSVHLRATFGGELTFRNVKTTASTANSNTKAEDDGGDKFSLRLNTVEDVNEEIARVLISSSFLTDDGYVLAVQESTNKLLSSVEAVSVHINLDLNPVESIEVPEENVETVEKEVEEDDVMINDQETSSRGTVAAVAVLVSILACCVVPYGILRYKKIRDAKRREKENRSQQSDEDTLELDPSDEDVGNAATETDRQWSASHEDNDFINDPEMSLASPSHDSSSNQFISRIFPFIPQTPVDESVDYRNPISSSDSARPPNASTPARSKSSRSTSEFNEKGSDGHFHLSNRSPRSSRVSMVYDDQVVDDDSESSSQGSERVENSVQSDGYYSRNDLRGILSQDFSFGTTTLRNASSLEQNLSRSMVTPPSRQRKRRSRPRRQSSMSSSRRRSGTMASIVESENEEDDIQEEIGIAYDTEDEAETEENEDFFANDMPTGKTQLVEL